MSRRTRTRQRCEICGLHLRLCICDQLPTVQTQTRILLIVHQRESWRPSNTGRLAHRCLPNSEILERGRQDQPQAELSFPEAARPALLFPSDEATPINQLNGIKPNWLIVPDGTWGQASRMRRRIKGLIDIPAVCLPHEDFFALRLRTADKESRLCTFEAIARALGYLEHLQIRDLLLHTLATMVDRTLWMKGRIDRAEVTGGIPEEIARHFPPHDSPTE